MNPWALPGLLSTVLLLTLVVAAFVAAWREQ
jgi:hypothetical protein